VDGLTFPHPALVVAVGAVAALEVAAQAIGPAVPHHATLGPFYNPFDGARWLANLNFRCLVEPPYAHFMNPRNLPNPRMPHALSCATPLAAIRAIDFRAGSVFLGGVVPAFGFGVANAIAKARKPDGRTFEPVRYAKGTPPPLVFPIGKATGILRSLGAESGIAKGQEVRFVGEDINRDVFAVGGKGEGKEQPVETLVFTPNGLRPMGDLKAGDYVIGRNGKPTKVLGVFPQGRKPGFRVTFSDGVSTVCGDEHLWQVSTGKSRFASPANNERRAILRREQGKGSTEYRPRPLQCKPFAIKTLAEIRAHMAKNYRAETNGRLSIPLAGPMEFEGGKSLPLDPYALGILIGDGCLAQRGRAAFSSADEFIVEEMREVLAATGTEPVHVGKYDYRLVCRDRNVPNIARVRERNVVTKAVRDLGLNVGSHEKFIPNEYKFACRKDRVALLQGLCDSDGFASRNCVEYSTTSQRLADDVVFLVQTLGGIATYSSHENGYTYKGEYRKGRRAYRVSIRIDAVQPFRLPRKASALVKRTKDQILRHINKIEPVGDRDMVCIKVEANDHLYVVEGAIVTHNTTSVINPILYEAFLQDCGAFILNVKGDYDDVAAALAQRAGRVVQRIGFGRDARQVNALGGVDPNMASEFISSLLLLLGNEDGNATFWNTTATNLSRAILGLLWYVPFHYSFPGLYRYIFVRENRVARSREIETLVGQLTAAAHAAKSEEEREPILLHLTRIASYQLEIKNFYKQTEQIQSGVETQLNQILAKTVVPELESAYFNTTDACEELRFEDLYEKGEAWVVNCPIQEYGLSAAAIILFMKLRFYATMEQRRLKPGANQTRQVALICDEHHEVAASARKGLSDPYFVAKSRDTGTFCVFATQSISALKDKIGDWPTRAFLANVRQKFVFRTEDRETAEDILYLLGSVETEKTSESETTAPGSWSKSKGTTTSKEMRAVANPSVIRALLPNQALCLLTIANQSADDVITMRQVFA
jgi:hypothetical protein